MFTAIKHGQTRHDSHLDADGAILVESVVAFVPCFNVMFAVWWKENTFQHTLMKHVGIIMSCKKEPGSANSESINARLQTMLVFQFNKLGWPNPMINYPAEGSTAIIIQLLSSRSSTAVALPPHLCRTNYMYMELATIKLIQFNTTKLCLHQNDITKCII